MSFIPANTTEKSICPYSSGMLSSALTAELCEIQKHRKSDAEILADVHDWMRSKLHCVAGRREFNRGRYMIEVVGARTIPQIFEDFTKRLQNDEAIACLLVFNEPRFYDKRGNTSGAFYYLAEQVACLGNVSPFDLANGEALSNTVRLRCPVTNQVTDYDDFECIAFCPQSNDEADPLYDPLMASPYPCVNISSDVFAFSKFVDDSAKNFLGKPVHAEQDLARVEDLFGRCVERWQRVATTTIKNFAAATNTNICPVHLSEDQTHWAAAHKDPAFAEQEKVVHHHELPILYGSRIVAEWLAFFKGEQDYSATGLAREGTLV